MGTDYKLLATTTNKNDHSHKHHQRVYYVLGTILLLYTLYFNDSNNNPSTYLKFMD